MLIEAWSRYSDCPKEEQSLLPRRGRGRDARNVWDIDYGTVRLGTGDNVRKTMRYYKYKTQFPFSTSFSCHVTFFFNSWFCFVTFLMTSSGQAHFLTLPCLFKDKNSISHFPCIFWGRLTQGFSNLKKQKTNSLLFGQHVGG